jgi:hypothetical protein
MQSDLCPGLVGEDDTRPVSTGDCDCVRRLGVCRPQLLRLRQRRADAYRSTGRFTLRKSRYPGCGAMAAIVTGPVRDPSHEHDYVLRRHGDRHRASVRTQLPDDPLRTPTVRKRCDDEPGSRQRQARCDRLLRSGLTGEHPTQDGLLSSCPVVIGVKTQFCQQAAELLSNHAEPANQVCGC